MSTDFSKQAELIRSIRDKAKGMRVLYVEDDRHISREYMTFLSRFFEEIRCEFNGIDGLNAALEGDYDLIITDVQMPQMGGLDMIERIKQQFPEQSTLLVSAYKDFDYLHRSVQLGIDGYLFKPIERNQTIDTLHKIIAKIKLEHENRRYKQHLEELVAEKTREVLENYTTDRISGLNSLAQLEQDILRHPEYSLVMLKISDFKNLNDTYGYRTGDTVLQQTAAILRNLVDQEKLIRCHGLYRTSGAHFVLLCPEEGIPLQDGIKHIISRFESTEMTVAHERMYLEMNAAIVNPRDDFSLSHADFALRKAEREGRIVVYQHSDHQNHENTRKLKCIDTIKRAVQENRFVPYYQPVIDNATMQVTKYEALARLVMPDGEVLSPGRFLTVAKESKIYSAITKMIIRTALDDFRDSECSISINLSIDDIKHIPTRRFLFQQIAAFPEPGRLVFELLESEGIDSYCEVQSFFAELKQLGCKVALDDFGSGYSNFEHLAKLNIDYLKIDGSLILTAGTDYVSRTIVEMLATFAFRIGVKTIAEFVETEHVNNYLQMIGITESQGFLFGPPIPFNDKMMKIHPINAPYRDQEAIITSAIFSPKG